jgi:hypothetical protein
MRPDMQRDLVIDALEMAWFRRCLDKKEGIFHSDRGSQYASDDFNKVLKRCDITPSMSRKGNCWDNACCETLFGSLKVERLNGQRFENIRQAKDEIIAWLLWYNQTRMHSTLNYVSPMQFEQDWADATTEIAACMQEQPKEDVEMPRNSIPGPDQSWENHHSSTGPHWTVKEQTGYARLRKSLESSPYTAILHDMKQYAWQSTNRTVRMT